MKRHTTHLLKSRAPERETLMKNKIEDLLNNDAFTNRHIGSSSEQKNQMLDYLGFDNLDKLIDEIVPDVIRRKEPMNIADGMSELAALKQLRNLARMNIRYKSFIGQGYYNSITPPVIQRNVEENPAWYTAYTPYQPEVAQGRLEMLLNYQQMILDFTGMDIANASLLDEATATAEAIGLSRRVDKNNLNKIEAITQKDINVSDKIDIETKKNSSNNEVEKSQKESEEDISLIKAKAKTLSGPKMTGEKKLETNSKIGSDWLKFGNKFNCYGFETRF